MRQVGSFADRLLAIDICEALRERGVASETTTQWQGAYIVQALTLVWVADDATDAVIAGVVAEMTAKREREPKSRVAAVDGHLKCVQCGYDLRGQRDDGNCPECGHAYELAKTFKCDGCGEEVPCDFAVCWKCGKEFEAADEDDAER